MSNPKWGTPEWHREHPIYYKPDDMKELPEVLIERIRWDLGQLRGRLNDIKGAYGWTDRITTAEEGLTLVISHLYSVAEEIKRVRRSEQAAK